MKKIKLYFGFLAIIALLFSSCTKDESSMADNPEGKTSISFAAVLNDFTATKAVSKAPLTGDVPSCSDGAPTKIRVALMQNGSWVSGADGDEGGFIEIPIIPNGDGGWMTQESSDLTLDAGTYMLEYFAVLDAADNVLWIAPRSDDDYGPANYAGFVTNALPLSIDLRLGVKKYVDVEVLCYDQRFADEYGYLFFDFNNVDTITLCVFGNDCDESGRHFPAHFSMEVWSYSGDEANPKGAALTNGALQNTVGTYDNGDDYAKPLCIALPDRDGEDLYYGEIRLLDFDGDGPGELIRYGVFNDTQVKALYNGETNTYYHFRSDCEGQDTPPIFDTPGVEASFYCVDLDPLNNSKVQGAAILRLFGNELTVSILAIGAESGADKPHAQHIHGKADGANASCPPADAAGEDGILTLGEGLPFYGNVLLPLDIAPIAMGPAGEIDYQETFMLGQGGLISAAELNSAMNPLTKRAIVLHGKTVNGSYEALLPIACGELEKLN